MMKDKTKNNIAKDIIILLFLNFLGIVVNLIVHELSHLLVLYICNGQATELSVGTNNFVAGYVPYQYISVVSLSSIYVPLAISCILTCIKQLYVQIFCGAFTLPSIISILFAVIANFTNQSQSERATYDLLLAVDNSQIPILVWSISILMFILSVIVMIKNEKFVIETI